MQKKLMFSVIALIILLLSGCHSNRLGNLFSPDGMTLTQSVQDALFNSGDPVIADLHVETNRREVTLSGYVKKIRQSDVAEQIAHQVPGVETVVNEIIVRK